MLFHSYEYLFFFLPLTLLGYFGFLYFRKITLARCFLLAASLTFYGWFSLHFLGLFLLSVLFNYTISRLLFRAGRQNHPAAKGWMVFGVCGNLLFLGFFKYADFCITAFNTLFQTQHALLAVAMPLAISFYTFQQIGFLADVYRKKVQPYGWMDYFLFVSFFPQLISGPITRHDETMEQLKDPARQCFSAKSCAAGWYQFAVGLGKKVLIADTLAQWVNLGYAAESLILPEAWLTTFAYTLQIYFDFSGYTDMAIGTARMFHIELPVNFDSPYKAVNIQDFWRRWHCTLSRFLRDNLYIPLGGSQKGMVRTCINSLITFVLCGVWHGAGWTYVLWGLMHGLAIVGWRIFHRLGGRMPKALGWLCTMLFLNCTFVLFRSPDLATAKRMFRTLFDVQTLVLPVEWLELPNILCPDVQFGLPLAILLGLCLLAVLLFPNSNEMAQNFVPRTESVVFLALIAAAAIVQLYGVNEFIYFNF